MRLIEGTRLPLPSMSTAHFLRVGSGSLQRQLEYGFVSSRPAIVIDKSYLDGVPTLQLVALAKDADLLLSGALFYELLTTRDKLRINSFRKLRAVENSVRVIGNAGDLYRHEISTGTPAGKPSSHILEPSIRIGNRTTETDLTLLAEEKQDLLEEEQRIEDAIEGYLYVVGLIPAVTEEFTALDSEDRTDSDSQPPSALVLNQLLIRRIYALLAEHYPEPMPASVSIDERWALYRRLQIQTLFALEENERHGSRDSQEISPKARMVIEHDIHDQEHLLLGVMEGHFATRENKLKRYFQLLAPDGRLYE